MFSQAEQILEKFVRPQLQAHSGDIQLLSLEGCEAKVRLLGGCSTCPSAHVTLTEIVERTLTEYLPEIQKVTLVQETTPELIDFAKKLLSDNCNG